MSLAVKMHNNFKILIKESTYNWTLKNFPDH